MKKEETTLLIFFIVLILFLILYRILTKVYTKSLVNSFKEDTGKFEKTLNSFIAKLLFPPYNREFMYLNYCVLHKKDKKVSEQIEKLNSMRINNEQHLAVYKTAIQYYVSVNNEKEARNIQKKLNEFIEKNQLDSKIKEAVDAELNIFFTKDISTLSYIDGKLENCSDLDKVEWNFKKAVVLKANDRLEEAKECMKIVIENTKNPEQKKAMQEILDNNLKDL